MPPPAHDGSWTWSTLPQRQQGSAPPPGCPRVLPGLSLTHLGPHHCPVHPHPLRPLQPWRPGWACRGPTPSLTLAKICPQSSPWSFPSPLRPSSGPSWHWDKEVPSETLTSPADWVWPLVPMVPSSLRQGLLLQVSKLSGTLRARLPELESFPTDPSLPLHGPEGEHLSTVLLPSVKRDRSTYLAQLLAKGPNRAASFPSPHTGSPGSTMLRLTAIPSLGSDPSD